MPATNDVEQLLVQLGRDWPAEATLVDRVLDRLGDGPPLMSKPPLSPGRRRWPRRLPQWAAAALLLLGLGVAWWLAADPGSLHAQVADAMRRARSLYVAGYVLVPAAEEDAGGEPQRTTATEAWFLRDRGFRYDLPGETRLGDTRYRYRFDRRQRVLYRFAPVDLQELLDERLAATATARALGQAQRFPVADAEIAGRPCAAFLVEAARGVAGPEPPAIRHRAIILVNDLNQIARVEHQLLRDERWTTTYVEEWSYDVPIDEAVFAADFGDDVRVVDAEQIFADLVDLQRAVHVSEVEGVLYAVHRIARFEGGGVAVMSSVRGTPALLEEYPLTRRQVQPGLELVEGPAANYDASPQGSGYFRIPLAYAQHQGIDVQWWIQVPRDGNPHVFDISSEQVWIAAGIQPRGAFGEVQRGNQLGWLTRRLQLDVPREEPPRSLADIAADAYADIAILEAIPNRRLHLGVKHSEPSGEAVQHFGRPDDTTPADFQAAVARHVAHWFQRDRDWERRRQQEQAEKP